MQKDLDALNAGRIDFAEFQRRQYRRQKAAILPELLAARRSGDWDGFITLALACYEVMPEAFHFYDEAPKSLKYNLAAGAYMNHGDRLPEVRKAVRSLPKYPRPPLPADLAGADAVTVYRAGEEPIDKVCRGSADFNCIPGGRGTNRKSKVQAIMDHRQRHRLVFSEHVQGAPCFPPVSGENKAGPNHCIHQRPQRKGSFTVSGSI